MTTETYAFCDTYAGYLQGLVTADCVDDALRLHAAEVGLIPEIGLDLRYAVVSQDEARALDMWADNPRRQPIPADITWRTLADKDVREVLGFPPRD